MSSVAIHVLERLSAPELLENVRRRGAQIADALTRLQQSNHKVRAVRGTGLIWGIDVVEPAKDIVARAMDAGLLVCSAGEHTVRLLPPLVITEADTARGLGLLGRATG